MTDIFRRNYTPLTDDQKALADQIKAKAEELWELYDKIMDGRQHELGDCERIPETVHARSEASRCTLTAKSRLEESVMWAAKAVTTEISHG